MTHSRLWKSAQFWITDQLHSIFSGEWNTLQAYNPLTRIYFKTYLHVSFCNIVIYTKPYIKKLHKFLRIQVRLKLVLLLILIIMPYCLIHLARETKLTHAVAITFFDVLFVVMCMETYTQAFFFKFIFIF